MNYVVIAVRKAYMYYCGIENNKPTFTERMTEAYIYEVDDMYKDLDDEEFLKNLNKINLKLFMEYNMLLSMGNKVRLEFFDVQNLLLHEEKE